MQGAYRNIRISDYSYDLPDERIAKYPLTIRDQSKMLVWNGTTISDRVFREFASVTNPYALHVLNNSRVIRARLIFRKESGAEIEIFCLAPHEPGDIALNLASPGPVEWHCLIGNLKRWKHGALETQYTHEGINNTLSAERVRSEGDAHIIRFSWDDNKSSFSDILDSIGHVPIPPYLHRADQKSDNETYQTVYATVDGSVAAPTAGLHFTPSVLNDLKEKGIETAEITLHVSAGTFRPVKSELICDHMMHAEHFRVTRHTLEQLRHRKIIAVGTTAVRALESIYWLGVKDNPFTCSLPAVSQWEPYDTDPDLSLDDAVDHLLNLMDLRNNDVLEARTDMIIIPGYRFRTISGLLTNFHQPKSTLLLLVAAFTGNAWKEIYHHALSSGYRFLSYGDCMLLVP